MTTLSGSCHCGAITLELAEPPVEATTCNCSLCRRTGALWHYCAPGGCTVSGDPVGYVQGDCMITTWHCPTCASVTHWTAIDPGYARMGVNLRMFDPDVWTDLPSQFVDGASF